MFTRRKFIAAALAAPVVPLGSVMAQAVKKEEAKQADFLFVQTSKNMSFDKATSKLTLEGVSSTTLLFSDRPERIAGNMKTTSFIPFWSTGKDSFLKDPPTRTSLSWKGTSCARSLWCCRLQSLRAII